MNERDNLLHRAGWLLSLVDQFGGVSVRRAYAVSEYGPSAEAAQMESGLDAYVIAAQGVVGEINRALGLDMPMADFDAAARIVNMGRARLPQQPVRRGAAHGPRRNPSAPRRKGAAATKHRKRAR